MKLIITDFGDPSVGIFQCDHEIECPFVDINDENSEWFKTEMLKIYQEYAQGRLEAHYDGEYNTKTCQYDDRMSCPFADQECETCSYYQ